MAKIIETLDKLKKQIQDPDFLEGKGLSNEINFHICCYKPEEEMLVRHYIKKLCDNRELGCSIIEYNLYEMFLNICENRKVLDKMADQEAKKGKEFILQQMKRIADNKAFVEEMAQAECESGDVIIVTGVGEVFPFIRASAVLEAMQEKFTNIPVVLMYPGSYNGHDLKLFDRLETNSYYRAFKVI